MRFVHHKVTLMQGDEEREYWQKIMERGTCVCCRVGAVTRSSQARRSRVSAAAGAGARAVAVGVVAAGVVVVAAARRARKIEKCAHL
jgi:hypothetical protein